jgi:hypothetical protein
VFENSGGRDGEHDKRQTDGQGRVGDEVGKELADSLRAAGHRPGHREVNVGDRPAGDHGIEGQDADTGEDAEQPDQPPWCPRLDDLE